MLSKQIYTITYKNRYPWMTNELRDKILQKKTNKLGQLKNEITSAIRNTEIIFYSIELETHKMILVNRGTF